MLSLRVYWRAAIVATAAAVLVVPTYIRAATEEQQSLVSDAKQRIAKGDLQGAEIQLRNAARANPNDPALHVQLSQLYLEMGNLPAAEVEARLARQNKGSPDDVDPPLAQALLQQGKFTELFRDIKPGARQAAAESQVRVVLGTAHVALQEWDEAAPLLREAEKLNDSVASRTAMAQFLLSQGDIVGAQKEVAAADAMAPDDPAVLRIEALLLRAQGNADAAIGKLNALLSKLPNNTGALENRAGIYMSQNKFAEAQADLDRAQKIAPSNLGVIFLRGLLLVREGKLQEADAQLATVSGDFSTIPYGYYLTGVVKLQLGQTEQAAANLSKYVARFPKAVGPRQLLARIDLDKRNYTAAINDIKPVVDADPADAASTLLLAQAYLATGRRGDALELYQRAAQAQPGDPAAAARLAEMKMETGQVQQGLGELDKLAQTATGAAVAGPALVINALNANDVSKAAEAAEALVKRDGKDVVAQSLLGLVRMAQGNYSDAAAIFQRISDKDPTLITVQHALAQAYLALGKFDEAKSVLQRLLKQHPDSISDVISLASLEANQKDEASAVELLQGAQRNSPHDPSPGLMLLKIYGAAKEWDKALVYARELEGQFPANPVVIDANASLRAKAGDAKGAASEYAKLVEVLPNASNVLVTYAKYQAAASDKTGARASLLKAHTLAPHDSLLMQNVVTFDMAASGADAALATARSFAKDDPDLSLFLVADVLEKSNRAEEAVALLTAEQQKAPSGPVAAKLGEALYVAGKRDDAVQLLASWTRNHDDLAPRLALANIYLEQHDTKDAQTLFEQVHDKAPGDVMALNNLAWIYGNSNDPRALDYAAEAYRLKPRPDIADTLGWILLRTGKPNEALSFFSAASEAQPEDGGFQYHLAAALSATGKKDQARIVLERLFQSGAPFDGRADAQQLLITLQHD